VVQIRTNDELKTPLCVMELQLHTNEIMQEWNNFINVERKQLQPIDNVSVDQKYLNFDKKWKAFFLYGFNFYNELNKEYFPKTTFLIKKWQSEITMVMFSTLESGKHIPPHRGRNYGVIRSQLGIDIKNPLQTGLKVNNKIIILKERDLYTFDDTFEHEAWNKSITNRTVLIIDTKRKLPFIYRIINNFIQKKIGNSEYILNTIENIKKQNQ
jgi:beta-hydroxylase